MKKDREYIFLLLSNNDRMITGRTRNLKIRINEVMGDNWDYTNESDYPLLISKLAKNLNLPGDILNANRYFVKIYAGVLHVVSYKDDAELQRIIESV